MSVNLILGVSFAYYLTQLNSPGAHAGLALAISIAALLNALLLYNGLRKINIIQMKKNWSNFLLKIFIANLAMFFCLSYIQKPLQWWLSLEPLSRSLSLLLTIIIGMIVYFSVLFLSGIKLDSFRFKSN